MAQLGAIIAFALALGACHPVINGLIVMQQTIPLPAPTPEVQP
jgi:hypothetical protein